LHYDLNERDTGLFGIGGISQESNLLVIRPAILPDFVLLLYAFYYTIFDKIIEVDLSNW
jgi:hypothetical protein